MITKRDGTKQPFRLEAITEAVFKAACEAELNVVEAEEMANMVAASVYRKLGKEDGVTVDCIQDAVEERLMVTKEKSTARAYIRYRAERDRVRESKSLYAKIGIDITSGGDTESQRENSNVPRNSVTTQVEMIKRLYSKKFAMDFILPKEFKRAHEAGEVHIHDAENLITKTPNCCLMHYPYMLEKGFQLGNKWIEEPTSILTTMNVLVQMVQVQSNLQFGGLTLQDIDVHLGKYVLGSYKKYFLEAMVDLDSSEEDTTYIKGLIEKGELHPNAIPAGFVKINSIAKRKTKQETYRSAKLLGYQLNTLQIRGESSPFVTISYGLSTTWEGRLIQECILQERLDEYTVSGVVEFPKHMMQTKVGVNLNEGDPNYDIFKKALGVSAKTCYPDYIFPDNQEVHTGGSATYMG